MFSTTLALPATTTATGWGLHEKHDAELHPLRMIWVMVNERNGNRRPQMFWRTDL
jgi:hypothetical protein